MNVSGWSLQQGDRGNRKRYLPSDKDRLGSPLSKRMAMSPDRGRTDRRTLLTHIHAFWTLRLHMYQQALKEGPRL